MDGRRAEIDRVPEWNHIETKLNGAFAMPSITIKNIPDELHDERVVDGGRYEQERALNG